MIRGGKVMKTRKRILSLLMTGTMVATVLAGCSSNGAATTGQTGQSSAADSVVSNDETQQASADVDLSQKEAPMLAEQVAAGTLPALEERLPAASDVMVEPDVLSLGNYGGSVSLRMREGARWNIGPLTEENMFRFKSDGSGEVEANVCKDYYANDDYTVWTIELREGMKWSDGEPFTADDILFYYDHMSTPALNEDRSAVDVESEGYYSPFTSKAYNCYQVTVDGIAYWAEFAKVDDYKITVTFKAPKPDFPEAVAIDNKWMYVPKHFYINYVSRKDGVTDDPAFPYISEEEALANANKTFGKDWESYSTMGKDIGYYYWDYNIIPTVRSFVATSDNWNKVGETYELVRNPYFFKTDSEGRQLPYVDSLKIYIINEEDQNLLKLVGGELTIGNFAENDYSTVVSATANTHHVAEWHSTAWNDYNCISLNQTVKDEDKRKLFTNKEFREALSIAVDRNLLNNTLADGMSEGIQAAPPEGARGYDEEWRYKWTEYDPDRANEILDGLTEAWDRTDGTYRKMKGTDKELEIIWEIADPTGYGEFISIVKSSFKAIGVKFSEKANPDVGTSILANDVEATNEVIATISPALRPDSVVPMRNFMCWYSAYGKWYEDGKSDANGGIEPEGDILELINCYDNIRNAIGADRDQVVEENINRIYELHKENTWVIGYLADTPTYFLIDNNLMNFPADKINCDEFRWTSIARLEQVYFKNVE
jgi:oligopeptide ABC transporter substrate-binding protein oppA2